MSQPHTKPAREIPPSGPFYGKLDLKDPLHVLYAISIALTPLVAIVCTLGFFVGGWFVGIMWWGWLCAVMPTEIEKAKNLAGAQRLRQQRRRSHAPRRKITGGPLENWYDTRPPGQYP